jgi:hypothetical protein
MNDTLFVIMLFVGALVVSLIGLYFTRKYTSTAILEAHNEEEGFVYAVIGVIYGVLLAFLVLVVWEQYNTANERAENEAAVISALNKDVNCYPDSFKLEFRKALGDYTESMFKEEYPAMARGEYSKKTDLAYKRIWELFYDLEPKTEKEKFWYPEVISKINELGKSRRLRIMSVEFGIPPFMWVMIIIGAAVTIGYSYLFYTKRFVSQLIMVWFLTATICISLIIVYALDHPFSGIIRVSDEPFRGIMHYFK